MRALDDGEESVAKVARHFAFDGLFDGFASADVLVFLEDELQLGVAQSAQNPVKHRLVGAPLFRTGRQQGLGVILGVVLQIRNINGG